MNVLRATVSVFGVLFLGLWGLVFAYADWLRFSSPRQPDPATGQVIYEKSWRGVFYITREQAWLVQDSVIPIWVGGAICILLGNYLHRKAGGEPVSAMWSFAGGVCVVAFIALFFFGDYVMALFLTGSLALPT